ncbi:MAG: peptidoglycan-binding protein [Micrococcaceae bacterium]
MKRLQAGDTSTDVLELRQRLRTLGISVPGLDVSSSNNPELFDDSVRTAVMILQQKRGLTVDGIAGGEVRKALHDAQWTLGERQLNASDDQPLTGDDVVELQKKLANLGFYQSNIDGTFGTQTVNALKELQLSLGVDATGIFDEETTSALKRLNLTMSDSKANKLRTMDRIKRQGSSLTKRKIIIDASGSGPEAAITSTVAHKVADMIHDFGGMVFVVDGSTNLTMDEREQFANDHPVDLYIGLSVEKMEEPAARGFAAFYAGDVNTGISENPAAEHFARTVCSEVSTRVGIPCLGTFARRWQLLMLEETPAVHFDLGYISNPEDQQILENEEALKQYAQAITIGLQRLYLPAEKDMPTGSISIIELAKFAKE